jgi:hypothetical protein
MLLFFWILAPCTVVVDGNVSEKHTVSIFIFVLTAVRTSNPTFWKYVIERGPCSEKFCIRKGYSSCFNKTSRPSVARDPSQCLLARNFSRELMRALRFTKMSCAFARSLKGVLVTSTSGGEGVFL